MEFSRFAESLKRPEPVYVLKTDQDYLKREVYEACLAQVAEENRGFNWSVYDLEKDSAAEVVNAARTLPWTSGHRWVYVRNAHLGEEGLGEYLKAPSPRTVLVLEAAKRPRSWAKLPTVDTPDAENPVRWLLARAGQEGYQMDRRAAETLVELAGENYQQLEQELEKQFLLGMEDRRITVESVLSTTRQTREYDIFALIGAVAEKNSPTALRILDGLFTSGMAAPQVLFMLYWNFRRVLVAREMLESGRPFHSILQELKIWSYKHREGEIRSCRPALLSEILLRIRETDRLCKTTSTDPRTHLERVIVDTCQR